MAPAEKKEGTIFEATETFAPTPTAFFNWHSSLMTDTLAAECFQNKQPFGGLFHSHLSIYKSLTNYKRVLERCNEVSRSTPVVQRAKLL